MDLREFVGNQRFTTVLADPPWRFGHRTGKGSPEYRRFGRYQTMPIDEIMALPVADCVASAAHLYLWVPNAMLPEGLQVMQAWGFTYKTMIVWQKLRKDGQIHRGGLGFYFRGATETLLFGVRMPSIFRVFCTLVFHERQVVTETMLFGVRGKLRTLAPARRQINLIGAIKRQHSRKPDEQYNLIETCSPGPYLELFARTARPGWQGWGLDADTYLPSFSRILIS